MKIKYYLILLITLSFMIISCTSASSVNIEKKEVKIVKVQEKTLEAFYKKHKGAPYQIGASGPGAFDCSGFVKKAFKEVYGINLPRTSSSQFMEGKSIRRYKDLKYGDLVFFNTNGRGVSHVGIYTSKNKFMHASTSLGVIISDIKMEYYKKRFLEGRRILK